MSLYEPKLLQAFGKSKASPCARQVHSGLAILDVMTSVSMPLKTVSH